VYPRSELKATLCARLYALAEDMTRIRVVAMEAVVALAAAAERAEKCNGNDLYYVFN
jgi:hypothetical protein